jgi:hypothetical protein
MDEDKLILYAAVAIGGFILYKKLFSSGATPQEAAGIFQRSGSSAQVTTPEIRAAAIPGGEVARSAVVTKQTDWLGYTTTSFWTQEDLNKLNPVQKFLMNIGIPVGVLIR